MAQIEDIAVIEDKLVLEGIDRAREIVFDWLDNSRRYCEMQCATEERSFSVFGFRVEDLEAAVTQVGQIALVEPYQEMRACAKHYVKLLREIASPTGYINRRFDKDDKGWVTVDISGHSLVFAPYLRSEPRVFIRTPKGVIVPSVPFAETRKEDEEESEMVRKGIGIISAFREAYAPWLSR